MALPIGAKPALGLSQLLEARALIAQYRVLQREDLEYHGKKDGNPLRSARILLNKARGTMRLIHDATIDGAIVRAEAQIATLQG